jgi:hypothetical protein
MRQLTKVLLQGIYKIYTNKRSTMSVVLLSVLFFYFFIVTLSLCLVTQQLGPHDTQHNEIEHNDIQYNDIQHNDIQHNDIQHNDIQHNDIQHNDIQHNDIQHNDTQQMQDSANARLSITTISMMAQCCYSECHLC